MKKYITDIVAVAIVLLVALVSVDKPPVEDRLSRDLRLAAVQSTASAGTAQEEQAVSFVNITRRNIFARSGSYEPEIPASKGKGLQSQLKTKYHLVAILKGINKQAVFMEYNGTVISVMEGERLPDGSTVVEIEEVSVKVNARDGAKEYRMFNVRNESQK